MTFSYLAPHCAISALPVHFQSTSGPLLVNFRFTSGLDSITSSALTTHLFHRDEISFHSWDQFVCPPTGFSMTSSSVQWAKVGSEAFVRNWDVCPGSKRSKMIVRNDRPKWSSGEMILFPSLRWSKSSSSSELISTIHSSDRDELIRRLGTGAK